MTTVAAVQLAVEDLDVDANLDSVARRTSALADRVDVAVFPEYALTGFVGDERIRDVALRRDGPELDRLRDIAARTDTALLCGFVERGDDAAGETDDTPEHENESALYNAAAYVRPSGEVTVSRKRHLWGDEREVLRAGSDRTIVQTPAGRTGLVTCYELNFVEDSAAFTRERVDSLFVVGAWPAAYSENWRLLLRARALDGVRWVVGAGRTGRKTLDDAGVEYAGRSAVVRPDGTVAAALSRDERDLVVDLDAEILAEQRSLVGIFDE
ncbi:hydrolase [Haloprofundus marisrubri]|uniref:Hydrolase n=1 Tax=Haloprofundus marisrubri TaxID=1514971 RepID=A0A0W1R9J4_9EURY|nr:carbon-nitrogen hydrolase family protein [Haloprofundus marisrubri]KTG10023.1 hydrolase [Haloprofundus marisrubri]